MLSFIPEARSLNKIVSVEWVFQTLKNPPEMPIKVVIKKLTPKPDNLPDQLKVEKLNEVAADFGAQVLNVLGKLKCQKHPDKVCRLTIIADRNQSMIINKKCCCREFEKLITTKLER